MSNSTALGHNVGHEVQEYWFIIDFLVAVLALILLAPLMLLISVVVGMTGPIFYRQVRVGKNNEEFEIIKFRTMMVDAEVNSGPVLATKSDVRITKIGNFLRATHLDELPQFINVVKGEMSLIGPRPERPVFTKQFEKNIAQYSDRHKIRPGITGLAQIKLAYDATAAEKIRYDLFYIQNKDDVVLNLKIAIGTVLKMLAMPALIRNLYSKTILEVGV